MSGEVKEGVTGDATEVDATTNSEEGVPWRFRDKNPDEYRSLDTNPYMVLHREMGPPVMTASQAMEHKGRWQEAFPREAPIHLEIGTGAGFFMAGMAARHPEVNWLGLEIRFKRVVQTGRRIITAGAQDQARIARYDARQLDDLFAPNEISELYVNHPDPWERPQDTRHRLLSPEFFATTGKLLRVGGQMRLKTDHKVNVKAAIENIAGTPFEVVARVDDIARDGAPWPDDIVTNYQRKFQERGEPVYAVVLRRV